MADRVVTVGIDLAARELRTRVCEITWSGPRPTARLRSDRHSDDAIRALIKQAADEGITKVGIDCPLGWPNAFVSALASYHALKSWHAAEANYDAFSYRLTDAVVREETNGPWPLSVSADKLGVVAFRCARILSDVRDVDRTGVTGPVAEVYPAAALRQWGLVSRESLKEHGSYKRSVPSLGKLFDAFAEALPVDVSAVSDECRRNHDSFDALVCAVLARAVDRKLTRDPSDDQRAVAAVEGWIHFPTKEPLRDLAERLLA